jgi:tetratricopeptide (TPR) repeat protein
MTASPRSDAASLLREAVARHQAGDLDGARARYLGVLESMPDEADALRLLGVAHLQQGRTAEAAALLRRALAARPEFAEAWGDLATALRRAGLPAEAVACWREALRLRPGDAQFRRALATCPAVSPPPDAAALHLEASERHAANDHEAALALFRRASLLLPDPCAALANAANELLLLNRPEDALATLEALPFADHPVAATAWRHRGAAWALLNQPHALLAACRACLALDPGNADANFGEASALLLLGQYETGWAGYESRQLLPDTAREAAPSAPLWLGTPDLSGRTLLLRAEQGFGDILQFVRYAPLLRGRAERVLLAVPSPLLRLLGGLADAVVDDGAELPPHDLQTPLMSLPLAFGTTLATIPADIPYLRPDPALAAAWVARLGPRRRLRVGVAWTGDPATPRGQLRRVPPEVLLPALAATGAELHVLQKEIPPQDRAALAGHASYEADLTDFAETAALLAQMDVVVSSCTSVAHLAGAMGRPTFVMLQFAADFRWLQHRSDSPWYPTATLFRQVRRGEWDPVIQAVAAAIRRLA